LVPEAHILIVPIIILNFYRSLGG